MSIPEDTFREGDKVRHREFQGNSIGEIIAIYERSQEADVLWPWSRGREDAGLCSLKNLVKA